MASQATNVCICTAHDVHLSQAFLLAIQTTCKFQQEPFNSFASIIMCLDSTPPSNNIPHLPTLSTACTSAPWSNKNLTSTIQPVRLALWRAVQPNCGYQGDRSCTHAQCITTGPVEGTTANTLWVCITSGVFACGIHGMIDVPMNAHN